MGWGQNQTSEIERRIATSRKHMDESWGTPARRGLIGLGLQSDCFRVAVELLDSDEA